VLLLHLVQVQVQVQVLVLEPVLEPVLVKDQRPKNPQYQPLKSHLPDHFEIR
jgi:hypothetical protein